MREEEKKKISWKDIHGYSAFLEFLENPSESIYGRISALSPHKHNNQRLPLKRQSDGEKPKQQRER